MEMGPDLLVLPKTSPCVDMWPKGWSWTPVVGISHCTEQLRVSEAAPMRGEPGVTWL